MSRTRAYALVAVAAATVGLLAGCGSSTKTGAPPPSSATGSSPRSTTGAGASPTSAATGGGGGGGGLKVASVQGVAEDTALHDELPAPDRKSLTLGTTLLSSLPYTTQSGSTYTGLQPQLWAAVGQVLGVRIDAVNASFEEVIPGVQDGKFDLGMDNFGVTSAREKVVDFVTYFSDGQGFIVPASSHTKPVTGPSSITNLCGVTIGTGAGTTFQQILTDQAGACKKIGKPAFKVDVYSDTAAPVLALEEGRIGAYMGPTAGDRYEAAHYPGLRFLSQYSSTPVGFVLAKHSPLDKPLQGAIDQLVKDGVYAKILKTWDVSSLGVTTSAINPHSEL